MDELILSKLSIRSENNHVVFAFHDKDNTCVRIREDHVPEIIEFIASKTDLASNRRATPRVDVTAFEPSLHDRFSVYVETPDGDWVEVTPINISLTGILVETDQEIYDEDLYTSVGLKLDDMNVMLPSIVVRRGDNLVAFQFIASIKDGRLNPAPELVAIFQALEMTWLKTRLK